MPLTYTRYLALDDLLSLQRPRSEGDHDEMLFIVIHQVYELWFKQTLHELDHLKLVLQKQDTGASLATLRRVLTIFKTLVAQVDVLETMTPISFSSFRDRLETASGFQSCQFRELEFLLGHKRPAAMKHCREGSVEWNRLQRRFEEPSVWDEFLHFLARAGHDIPADQLRRDVTTPIEGCAEVQKILLVIYREDSLLDQICERLVDLDEGMQEWRYRHVKMVERTIGIKRGTGGSSGVDYLKESLFRPLFPDLWAIRVDM